MDGDQRELALGDVATDFLIVEALRGVESNHEEWYKIVRKRGKS
jgi:hypothetical protein